MTKDWAGALAATANPFPEGSRKDLSPGLQHRFRSQPGKAALGEALEEGAVGFLVTSNLFSLLIFGNPDQIIILQEQHPVGAGQGASLGKEPGPLVSQHRAANNEAVLGIEAHGAGVEVEGAHKHGAVIQDKGLGV